MLLEEIRYAKLIEKPASFFCFSEISLKVKLINTVIILLLSFTYVFTANVTPGITSR